MKTLLPALAALLLSGLAGCHSKNDPQPGVTGNSAATITVKVSEAGAPEYDLQDAHVLNSNYQSGAAYLTIAGKLNNGKLLTLNFTKTGAAAANTTNALAATLNDEAGTNAIGTTTRDPSDNTASGTFQVTFAAPGVVSGSFSKVAL